MDLSVLISVLTISILFYYIYNKFGGSKKKIPGPFGIPLLGFLPFLRSDAFRQFQEMTVKYGKIFQVQIGLTNVIVLNDWVSINEALNQQREVFSGRPQLTALHLLTANRDIASQNSSPAWKIQRKFAQNTLRDMGMGKPVAEMAVEEEANKFLEHLEKFNGKTIPVNDMFFYPVANIVWNIATGSKLKYDHPETKYFSSLFHSISEFISSPSVINFLPALRHVLKSSRDIRAKNEKFNDFIRRSISEHKSSFISSNEPKDYIEAYLQKMQKKSGDGAIHHFDELHLLADVYAFLHAGTETTANTLSFAVIYVSQWQDAQLKVQEEIDRNIGKSRRIQYGDRQRLPYTEAVLLEVQRCISIVPFGIAHMTKSATKLCGFDIGVNAEVWPNIWAVHHDPELWGDPEAFRPERFLDVQGKVTKPEYLIPFALGARRCIGEDLAKMELFVFFATIMQHFQFTCPLGMPPPSLEPEVGVTLRPQSYSLSIDKRL